MTEIIMQIGKSGVTENLINEVRLQLKKGKKVRMRILKSATRYGNRRTIADSVAKMANAKLSLSRGNVFILER